MPADQDEWEPPPLTAEERSAFVAHIDATLRTRPLPGLTKFISGTLEAAYQAALIAARRRAVLKGQPFGVTADQFSQLVLRAEGCCMLTGIPFDLTRSGFRVAPYAPSLDRIDSSRGYELANVRLVTAAANLALGQFGEAVFARLAAGYISRQSALAS